MDVAHRKHDLFTQLLAGSAARDRDGISLHIERQILGVQTKLGHFGPQFVRRRRIAADTKLAARFLHEVKETHDPFLFSN